MLVISSFTVHFAVKAAEQGKRQLSLWLMITTVVLGALFLANQLLEYAGFDFTVRVERVRHDLLHAHRLSRPARGRRASWRLTLVIWVVFSRHSHVPSAHTLRVTGYYWHLVDVVWVAVFLTVYVLR